MEFRKLYDERQITVPKVSICSKTVPKLFKIGTPLNLTGSKVKAILFQLFHFLLFIK